ncbi:hypothetical protein [Leifsonia shinshuensis]
MALPVSVKVFIVAAMLFVLVATLIASVSATAATNGRYNVNSLQFEKDVQASTVVKGLGDSAIAILTTTAAGSCGVKVWEAGEAGGHKAVFTKETTAAGACTASTAAATFPSTAGTLEVGDLSTVSFAVENLGGRTITFDDAGNPTLASGSRPASVSEADWTDLRPYRITLDLSTAANRVGTYAKSRQYVGTTRITNVPQADPSLHYVPPATPVVAPSALTITGVVRSNSAGASYSGAREGATITITGGVCAAGTTKLTITYTPATPTGLPPVSTITVAPLTGAAYSVELAGVQNGSEGTVLAVASCGDNSMTVQDQRDYHQAVPPALLTVKQGTTPEQYVLTWTAVSSLATSFEPSWSTSFGTDDQMPETTGLTATKAFATGTTYGATITFWVTAGVGDDSTKSAPAAITTAWPATPAGANMTYSRTGYSGNFVSGQVTWSFTGTCPAGTTIQASQLENRTGQSNGTVSNTVNYQGPFQNNLTKVPWSPSYATQGYLYGMGLQTRCASPNGLYSPVVQVQSNSWITPFATPAQSSWQAFNFRDYVRGTGWTYNTCAASNCAKSIQVDWGTACPAGTWVGWSNWYSRSWTGNVFTHPYGYQDNWGLPSGVNSSVVTYYGAQYYCSSPWANSPYSPATGGVNVSVLR